MCGPLRKDHLGPPGLAGPSATGVRLRFQVRGPKDAGEGLERGQQGASVGSPRPLPGLRAGDGVRAPPRGRGPVWRPLPPVLPRAHPSRYRLARSWAGDQRRPPGRRLHPPPGLRHPPSSPAPPRPAWSYQPWASGRTCGQSGWGLWRRPGGRRELSGDVRAGSALGVGQADAEAHPREGREGIGAGLGRRSPSLPSTPPLAARSSIPCAPSS